MLRLPCSDAAAAAAAAAAHMDGKWQIAFEKSGRVSECLWPLLLLFLPDRADVVASLVICDAAASLL